MAPRVMPDEGQREVPNRLELVQTRKPRARPELPMNARDGFPRSTGVSSVECHGQPLAWPRPVQAPASDPSGAAEVPASRDLDTRHAHRIAEQDLLLHQHLTRLHQVEEELRRCQLYASWIESERNDLRQSWSWRLMAPVRWVGGVFIHPKRTLGPSLGALGQAVHKPLRFLVQMVLRRPELSRYLNTWLMHSPRSHRFLKGLLRSEPLSGSESLLGQGGLPACAETSAVDVASLSQHGRKVYQALCAALGEQRSK